MLVTWRWAHSFLCQMELVYVKKIFLFISDRVVTTNCKVSKNGVTAEYGKPALRLDGRQSHCFFWAAVFDYHITDSTNFSRCEEFVVFKFFLWGEVVQSFERLLDLFGRCSCYFLFASWLFLAWSAFPGSCRFLGWFCTGGCCWCCIFLTKQLFEFLLQCQKLVNCCLNGCFIWFFAFCITNGRTLRFYLSLR